MKVAVIGSRDYPDLKQVRKWVKENLTKDDILVSGGARGVDRTAEDEARNLGIEVRIYFPDYAEHGREAPLVRNRLIVRAADRLVAFWDGRSRGTAYTVHCARREGKPVEVIEGKKDEADN